MMDQSKKKIDEFSHLLFHFHCSLLSVVFGEIDFEEVKVVSNSSVDIDRREIVQ